MDTKTVIKAVCDGATYYYGCPTKKREIKWYLEDETCAHNFGTNFEDDERAEIISRCLNNINFDLSKRGFKLGLSGAHTLKFHSGEKTIAVTVEEIEVRQRGYRPPSMKVKNCEQKNCSIFI